MNWLQVLVWKGARFYFDRWWIERACEEDESTSHTRNFYRQASTCWRAADPTGPCHPIFFGRKNCFQYHCRRDLIAAALDSSRSGSVTSHHLLGCDHQIRQSSCNKPSLSISAAGEYRDLNIRSWTSEAKVSDTQYYCRRTFDSCHCQFVKGIFWPIALLSKKFFIWIDLRQRWCNVTTHIEICRVRW